jgi:DNA gyrase/topoisomerase IV subunit A
LGAKVQRDSNEPRGKIQELERKLQSMESQFHATINELESVNRRYGELEESTRRHGEQMQVVKEALRRAEAHHAQTRHLLEERTTELTSAQRFLTQTDSLSGAEVIAMAESLNAEILQAAAYMADSLVFSYGQIPSKAAVSEQTHRRVRFVLGEPIMQVLRSRWEQDGTDFDPTPIQIALQIAMVYCSAKITELWVHDDRGKENETLANIFSRIVEKGTSIRKLYDHHTYN